MEIYFWRPRSLFGAGVAKFSRIYRSNFHPSPEGLTNFGDELGPQIVGRILMSHGLPNPQGRLHWVRKTFFSVGSVTHVARNGDIIWGSGALGGLKPALRRGVNELEIHALRGPLTKQLFTNDHGISDFKCAFGDPAILLPLLFPELAPIRGSSKGLIVSHMDDAPLENLEPGYDHVRATSPWKEVVRRIAGASSVVTSSLHGKILADAYGVPSVVYQGARTKPFKFEDYAAGTSQSQFEILPSLQQALEGVPEPAPDLSSVQASLIKSFPFHLFR